MRSKLQQLVAAATIIIAAPAASGAIPYELVTVFDGRSTLTGINDSNEISGYTINANNGQRGFYWSQQTGRIDVPPLGNPNWTHRAVDIDERGVLPVLNQAGWHFWDPRADTLEFAVSFPGFDPIASNNLRALAGQRRFYDFNSGHYLNQAYLWSSGTGLQSVSNAARQERRAVDINDGGFAAVNIGNDAFVYDWNTIVDPLEPLVPGVTGHSAQVWALSNDFRIGGAGMAVGQTYFDVGGSTDAYAAFWTGGGAPQRMVGAPDRSEAFGVNERGQSVGQFSGARGFLYDNGTFIDLNDRIIGNDGGAILVTSAVSINNRGWIIGTGPRPGAQTGRTVVLIPRAVREGDFDGPTLADVWIPSLPAGTGSIDTFEYESDEFAARLTAGSEVVLSQFVSTPSVEFDLGFDAQFLDVDASQRLTVSLAGTDVAVLDGPAGSGGGFESFLFRVNAQELLAQSDIELAFSFFGASGSRVLIDNVLIEQPAAAVVPLPATVWLMLGALAAFRRRG